MNAVIMMGLPGAGKTTYCAKYLAGYYRVSADDFHTNADGEYHYRPEFAAEAHRTVKREFALWACRDESRTLMQHIVVDNTNVCMEDIAFFIECAMAFDHTVQVLYLHSPDAFHRQLHGVPLDIWQAMAERAKLTILSWPTRWPKTHVVRT